MHRRSCIALLAALLLGCRRSPTAHPPTFAPISLRSGIYTARIETTTAIDSTGHLRRVRIVGKSYGPHDIDPARQRVEVREGLLTTSQLDRLDADLASCTGPTATGGMPDGPDLRLERGGQPLFTGGTPAEPIQRAIDEINRLSESMPITR